MRFGMNTYRRMQIERKILAEREEIFLVAGGARSLLRVGKGCWRGSKKAAGGIKSGKGR